MMRMRTVQTIVVLASIMAAMLLSGCEQTQPESYIGEDGREYFTGAVEGEGFRHVSPEVAEQIIDWGDCVVVDVREPAAYDTEHIPGAMNLAYNETFATTTPETIPNLHDTVVVYCDYGGISKMAAQDLVDAGYTDVVEFNGMEVWPGATESGASHSSTTEPSDGPPPWGKWASGLLLGMVFGYVAKRSRFCMTGLVRDTYLEKRAYNIVLILAIISILGLLYFWMGRAGFIRLPLYLPPFSLLSIALGSFAFGFGAVLANGCLVSTLIKAGDGRVVGLVSLGVFMVCGFFMSAGPGSALTSMARSVAIVDDNLIGRLSAAPVIVFAVLATACILVMAFRFLKQAPSITPPANYRGLRHFFFEAAWPRELMVVAIAFVLAAAFPISEAVGRHYGFAVATPVLSWSYSLFSVPVVVGGCNPFDIHIGWASWLVLGIILGSFLTTLASGELSLVKPDKATLLKSIAGSALMGFGAVLGQGCLLSNGLVGTAQLSAKSWYAFLFLALGILLATRLLLKKHGQAKAPRR